MGQDLVLGPGSPPEAPVPEFLVGPESASSSRELTSRDPRVARPTVRIGRPETAAAHLSILKDSPAGKQS